MATEREATPLALLRGMYLDPDFRRYLYLARYVPRQGMRRVHARSGTYTCWLYEDGAWRRGEVLHDRAAAVAWWLGDPWLPNGALLTTDVPDGRTPAGNGRQVPGEQGPGQFRGMRDGGGGGEMAADPPCGAPWPGYARRGTLARPEWHGPGRPGARWSTRQWEEATLALEFHIVMETGARSHDVGPQSSETAGHVYERLRARDAAAEVYWYEPDRPGRWEDLRASCPVRTDISPVLRCVVLAEAAVILARRPHADAYIGIDFAPRGVGAAAAGILDRFGVPPAARDLLAS
jgi:hypothetical protein